MTDQPESEPAAAEEPAAFAPPEAPGAGADPPEVVAPEVVAPEADAPGVVADVAPPEAPTEVVTPDPVPEPIAPPEPTPTVSAADASFSRPAGSAAPPPPSPLSAQAYEDRPEVLVGAAFAGGILAALILKRLGK